MLRTLPAGPSTCPTTPTVTLSVVSYPVKATSSIVCQLGYQWQTACWAYPRQCHGDADGKKQLVKTGSDNDLAIFEAAFNKEPASCWRACADFDHKKSWSNTGSGSNDLAIFQGLLQQGGTFRFAEILPQQRTRTSGIGAYRQAEHVAWPVNIAQLPEFARIRRN